MYFACYFLLCHVKSGSEKVKVEKNLFALPCNNFLFIWKEGKLERYENGLSADTFFLSAKVGMKGK